ncbi:acyl-CoA synthetase short chain family member 2 like isoform X1 [Chiloscyllium plagiosum]|uniref:acyl-CoA synthetase short chain family member 2 like isoform X1 n=2 Tax=Chiloscyllium plagiosum TaxID=36176 RepID=UPI001CB81027|nr:acyl-CoA synthetase short chain family member 2 like isoform X1 [Chiloscyllium plagiosum]
MSSLRVPGRKLVYHPDHILQPSAHVPDLETYTRLYKQSVENPEEFWGELAKGFYWKSPPKGTILDYNFDVSKGNVYVKFMQGATTNICYNLLDRNIQENGQGDKIAYFWEGNEPHVCSAITYSQLLKQVCKFANVLRTLGVKKGDRVAIYLPVIPELIYAMLACARIGVVHSVVFAGFSAESLCERILDSQCVLLVTADGFYRGEKLVNLKQIADDALEKCKDKENFILKKCIVVQHLGDKVRNNHEQDSCNILQLFWNCETDICWDALMKDVSEHCEPEWVDAEHPLFILYTSGSTGKPKGVLHTVAGYLIYTAVSFKYVFDYHDDDVYWCTADIGWITGHSYVIYGPLANGATCVLFEGLLLYPHVGRLYEMIEKYKVTKLYTAPTVIRMLMKFGEEPVRKFDLKSLRILGCAGEPINPEAWTWYHRVIGNGKCPIVDTFWQTETGGPMMTPLPAATPLKPGSTTFPFFGVLPAILNEHGEELEGEAEGYLVFKQPWPSILRTVYGDKERFETTYFKQFPGFYLTGDSCRRDGDGYYWITGRIDDMLNVSGHLLSSAEVESALAEHSAVAEVAVVSHPHPVKGECIYCFVTLKDGRELTQFITDELKSKVRQKIGPIATPDFIQNAPGLPKTRSGKIMRRILRRIACNEKDLGDTSTLIDPSVVEVLFSQRCQAAA